MRHQGRQHDSAAVAQAPGWNVVGVGDVNGDGYADIVIQNPGSGQIAYINMAGGVFAGFVGVAATPGYTVKAVADLTGDGFADIVVQSTSAPPMRFTPTCTAASSAAGASRRRR